MTNRGLEQVSHSTATGTPYFWRAVQSRGLVLYPSGSAGPSPHTQAPEAIEALQKQVKLVQVFTREQGNERTHWEGRKPQRSIRKERG